MGDQDFDLDLHRSSRRKEALTSKSETPNPQSEIEQSLLTSAATKYLSRSARGLKFAPLPSAAKEARSIAKLLGGDAELRLGKEAREAELKAVVSPRVLHLATHGFFFSDQEFKYTNSPRRQSSERKFHVTWAKPFHRSTEFHATRERLGKPACPMWHCARRREPRAANHERRRRRRPAHGLGSFVAELARDGTGCLERVRLRHG
jgi:hypothetical protein